MKESSAGPNDCVAFFYGNMIGRIFASIRATEFVDLRDWILLWVLQVRRNSKCGLAAVLYG